MSRTRMSASGEIALPKAVRDAHGFEAGAEFEVIDGDREITLRVIKPVPPSAEKKLTVEEFLAKRISYDGPGITDEMIDAAILEEAKRRWDDENSD